MNEPRFVADREPAWRELQALLDRAQVSGLKRLTGAQVRRLGALYRAASADLATARSLASSEDLVMRLNRLCAGAHGVVYSGSQSQRTVRLRDLLLLDFPREVRRTGRWHLFSAAAFAAAGAATYFVLRAHPDLAERELGPLMRQRAERVAALPPGEQQYLEVSALFMPVLSWGLMINNIAVTLLLFGTGAATVVLGVLVVLFNGVSLGAGFAVFADHGVEHVLATWVAAHGPLELMAVFIAAGAGMHVGASWMLPGRRSRGASFGDAAMRGLRILLGTTVFLVVAGLLEGHVSPSSLPAVWKTAIGAVTGGAGLAWILLGGRSADRKLSNPDARD